MCFTLVRLTACRVGQSGIISDKDGLRLPGSPGLSLGERSCHGDESECVCGGREELVASGTHISRDAILTPLVDVNKYWFPQHDVREERVGWVGGGWWVGGCSGYILR